MVRDLAGDQRYGAAPRADVKRRSPSSEGVLRHERGVANSDRQPGIGVRSPDATVLDAERATARARRNLGRVSFPFELEGDVAAVAFTFDEHVAIDAGRFSSALLPWIYTLRQQKKCNWACCIFRRFARESSGWCRSGTRPGARPYNSPAHGPDRIFPQRPADRRCETRASRRAEAGERFGLDARSDAGVPARARRRGRGLLAFRAADAAPARAAAYA